MNFRVSMRQLRDLRKLPEGWNYGADGPLTPRAFTYARLALGYLATMDAQNIDILPSNDGGATILAKCGDDTAEIIARSDGLYDLFFDNQEEYDAEGLSYGELIAALEEAGWQSLKSYGSHTHVFTVGSIVVSPAPHFAKKVQGHRLWPRRVSQQLGAHCASIWTNFTQDSEEPLQYSGGSQRPPLLLVAD